MRISQAHTGNKLNNFNKTFGELKEGDTIYWALYATKDIEDTIYTVTTIKGSNNLSLTNVWTDLNPKKQETIKCDLLLRLKNNKKEYFYRGVPSNATYCADNYSVYATSQELLIQVLKKYNIASPLI